MAMKILASPTRLAVVSPEPFDPEKTYGVECDVEGNKYESDDTWEPTQVSQQALVLKPPDGWSAKPGQTRPCRVLYGGAKRTPMRDVEVVDEDRFDALVSEYAAPAEAQAQAQSPAQASGPNGGGYAPPGPPERNGRGDRERALQSVLSFPLPTRSADAVGAGATGPRQAQVQRLLRHRLPISDITSPAAVKRALLNQVELSDVQGVETLRLVAGRGGLGLGQDGMTHAAHLSLALQVKEIAGEIVETLRSPFPNRDDIAIETTREVLRRRLAEAPEALSRPVVSTALVRVLAEELRAALVALGRALGFYTNGSTTVDPAAILVADQDEELTRFRVLERWVGLEADALEELATTGEAASFGSGVYRLEQYLEGAGQAATFVRTTSDQLVDFTALERRNYTIELGDGNGEISFEELLDLVEYRIAAGYRSEIAAAGRPAVRAGIPSLRIARDAVLRILDDESPPTALLYPIVREGLQELADQLDHALEAAEELAAEATATATPGSAS
jgi:hypothetical protein